MAIPLVNVRPFVNTNFLGFNDSIFWNRVFGRNSALPVDRIELMANDRIWDTFLKTDPKVLAQRVSTLEGVANMREQANKIYNPQVKANVIAKIQLVERALLDAIQREQVIIEDMKSKPIWEYDMSAPDAWL